MGQRIKGQETIVTAIGPNGIEEGFTAVKSFEAEIQMELLTENYLGETTTRKDDIFHGMRGKLEFDMENTEFFRFAERVTNRAQRRAPATASDEFTIQTVLSFPSGESQTVLFQDVFFEAIPFSVGSRSEYMTGSVGFESSRMKFLT